jgi:hypothetical protein
MRFLGLLVVLAAVLQGCPSSHCNSEPEAQQLFYRGKCGPDTTVMASVDSKCDVTLAGAAAAGLPEQGVLDSTGSQPPGALLKDGVNIYNPDGGLVSCTAMPADGGLFVECRQPCPGEDAGDNCSLVCDGFLFSSPPP